MEESHLRLLRKLNVITREKKVSVSRRDALVVCFQRRLSANNNVLNKRRSFSFSFSDQKVIANEGRTTLIRLASLLSWHLRQRSAAEINRAHSVRSAGASPKDDVVKVSSWLTFCTFGRIHRPLSRFLWRRINAPVEMKPRKTPTCLPLNRLNPIRNLVLNLKTRLRDRALNASWPKESMKQEIANFHNEEREKTLTRSCDSGIFNKLNSRRENETLTLRVLNLCN